MQYIAQQNNPRFRDELVASLADNDKSSFLGFGLFLVHDFDRARFIRSRAIQQHFFCN